MALLPPTLFNGLLLGGRYATRISLRTTLQHCLQEEGIAQQHHVVCLDILDRIRGLTYALSQLARGEDQCVLKNLAVSLLTEMVGNECESLREIVRLKDGAAVR